MKEFVINAKSKFVYLFAFAILLAFFAVPGKAFAEDDVQPVTIKEIDYEKAYMVIDPNGNTKVYYSATGKDKWYQVEGSKNTEGYFVLDISWISEKSDYKLSLKGSDDTTVVDTVLPAMNSSIKIKYSAADCELTFENEEGATVFEWKKSTSYVWNTDVPISQADDKGTFFKNAMEELKLKGGKIIVRLPQQKGTSATNTGSRPSKQVSVSIPKRAAAPSIKVNVTKLTVNTTTSMEYGVYSIGGTPSAIDWADCEKAMLVSDLAPEVFAGKDVVIAFRKAATSSAGYSQTAYVTIPAQKSAPTEYLTTVTPSKFTISFPGATKENPIQYAVVKAGTTIAVDKLSWKNVTSSKGISFSIKNLPAGSTIYMRFKGIAESKTVSLALPSAMKTITVTYPE